MSLLEIGGPNLTGEQRALIQALAKSVTAEQALWLSGYFAGLEHGFRQSQGERHDPGEMLGGAAGKASPSVSTRALTILYGSETGNGAKLAKSLAQSLSALQPVVADMADYKVRKLKDEQDLVVITSTHGEGDPPQSAKPFFEFLESKKAPKLPSLCYAVLALGDSTYEHYCEGGKRIDKRLAELGAQALMARVDCDVDYEEPAAEWAAHVVKALTPDTLPSSMPADIRAAAPLVSSAVAAFDKDKPFTAQVIDNLVLTGRGSSKETRHIELSLAGSGLAYEPGDALGIVPRNDPALVERLLHSLQLAGDAPVEVKKRATTLAQALLSDLEITIATPRFIERWAELSGADDLRRFLAPDAAEARRAFLYNNHVIDIVRAFPVKGVDAQQFLGGLRPMQPRLYSIASSQSVVSGEAHLTVATVRYELNSLARAGVASGMLADRAPAESELPVYIQANPHFRLPADDVPILMIGAGTGVAPYRAFLQEREARGARGKSWLVFGERNFHTDFLYQIEWQDFLKSGVLTRMSVAFSRDHATKTYVQHRLLDQARDVFAWLEEGARTYVCGDAAHMAPDVHAALIQVVGEAKGCDAEAAEDYLRSLREQHRYQVDAY